MRLMVRLLMISLFLFGSASAQHPDSVHQIHGRGVTGPQGQTELELDNSSVQVLRVRLSPHERIPMHDVTPRVVVWLTDAHIRATFENGTVRDERGEAGHVEWVPAQRHAAENLDDHAVEFIAIVPKAATGSPHQGR
jgi:quercetin dioxygenase-like cupin family protein